jgi:DNA polymerase
MAWTEHQQAVLQAMGLRVWAPTATEAEAGSVAALQAPPDPPGVTTMPDTPASRPVPGPAPVMSATVVPGVATLDWPALRAAVADCRACSLCETRRQTVFGVGSERARWMVVGEAPGEQEDRRGEPFVGPAGQLLDRMLAALDLSRSAEGDDPARQVYIANTLKCRPPGNRNPAAEELARCEPFLQRQIALVRPRIILAMGRFAVQSLLRSDAPIGKLRGQVHAYQGVPLVVTYHPAYLLRNLPDKAKAWADLCLAAETADATGG